MQRGVAQGTHQRRRNARWPSIPRSRRAESYAASSCRPAKSSSPSRSIFASSRPKSRATRAASSTSCAATGSRPRSSLAASGCSPIASARSSSWPTPCSKSPTTPGSTETYGSCREQALVDEIKNAQLAYEQVRAELQAKQCMGPRKAARSAHEQAPRRLGLLRFPYGACSPAALERSRAAGPVADPVGRVVRRSDRSGCRRRQSSNRSSSNVAPGSIVLFHANGRGWHTEGALPAVVAALKAQGYEFVTVSELLAAGEPVMSADLLRFTAGRRRPMAVPASARPSPPRHPASLAVAERPRSGARVHAPGVACASERRITRRPGFAFRRRRCDTA